MPTLIAEDLLLLMLDDSGAFVSSSDKRRPALAGAILAELALAGAVEVETEGGWWKRRGVVVEDAGAVSDPLLLGVLDDIATRKRAPKDLVNRIGRDLPDHLCARLADRGVLRRHEGKVLGLFPRTRWPAVEPRPAAALRAQVRRVLVERGDPDERVAAVIAVLAAADLLHQVVDPSPLSRKDLQKRAAEVAAGGWASEAVRKAIQAAQTAVAAGATAAIVAGTASAGS